MYQVSTVSSLNSITPVFASFPFFCFLIPSQKPNVLWHMSCISSLRQGKLSSLKMGCLSNWTSYNAIAPPLCRVPVGLKENLAGCKSDKERIDKVADRSNKVSPGRQYQLPSTRHHPKKSSTLLYSMRSHVRRTYCTSLNSRTSSQ